MHLFPSPSLSDRLLQPQVMPFSLRRPRRFRGVQMCLAPCLLALLPYPQVSPPPTLLLPVDLRQLSEPVPNTVRTPTRGALFSPVALRETQGSPVLGQVEVKHKAVGTDGRDSGMASFHLENSRLKVV